MGKATIPPPLRGTSLYTREALRGEQCSPAGTCGNGKLHDVCYKNLYN